MTVKSFNKEKTPPISLHKNPVEELSSSLIFIKNTEKFSG
jgi:hypothetical protein